MMEGRWRDGCMERKIWRGRMKVLSIETKCEVDIFYHMQTPHTGMAVLSEYVCVCTCVHVCFSMCM